MMKRVLCAWIALVLPLEPLLVPLATNDQKNQIELLVDTCNNILSENIDADVNVYENLINTIVFDMYNLNSDEREFIKSQIEIS